jgi:DNA-binding NarL/FixJ family response regulator
MLTKMRTIRVVLADDHAVMRIGIRNLLSRSPDIEVVGEGSNGLEAIELVNKFKPDVLVLDMEMPIMDGVEAARRLRESQSPVKILALSSYNDKYYISRCSNKARRLPDQDETPTRLSRPCAA